MMHTLELKEFHENAEKILLITTVKVNRRNIGIKNQYYFFLTLRKLYSLLGTDVLDGFRSLAKKISYKFGFIVIYVDVLMRWIDVCDNPSYFVIILVIL